MSGVARHKHFSRRSVLHFGQSDSEICIVLLREWTPSMTLCHCPQQNAHMTIIVFLPGQVIVEIGLEHTLRKISGRSSNIQKHPASSNMFLLRKEHLQPVRILLLIFQVVGYIFSRFA